MNQRQYKSLEKLNAAIRDADDAGLFDILQGDCESPDSINDVIDAVAYALEERQVDEEE